MLINLTNHSCETWNEEQTAAAQAEFGIIQDMPFPAIPPEWETEEVVALARKYVVGCRELIQRPEDAVHIMGELTFTYAFIGLATDIRCIASTSERRVTDHPGGDRTVSFRFVRFRDYNRSQIP